MWQDWYVGDEERDIDLELKLKYLHQTLPPIRIKVCKESTNNGKELQLSPPVDSKRPIVTGYRCISSPQSKPAVVISPRPTISKPKPVFSLSRPKLLNTRSRVMIERLQTVPVEQLLKLQNQYECYSKQLGVYEENRVKVTRVKVQGMLQLHRNVIKVGYS
jgi:hypothetical protein